MSAMQSSILQQASCGRQPALFGRAQSQSRHATVKPTAAATAERSSQQQQQGNNRNRKRRFVASDGKRHLGSALTPLHDRPFPGPPPNEGPPLRILPIGGLGEIGMNCMLVGVRDRYILIDAGLMFPDFADLGMQKILPDTSFLHQWKDKIEAVVITHGHEDHIGALPWVVPALDPSTPIYASDFVMQLVSRRMEEYSLWNNHRFRTFSIPSTFTAGPFEISPVRVTHSIPDCCGLIMRSEYGSIVHTGDWKIDENPVDGQIFDRTTFDLLGKENVALMMSDSTNVLSPGRTLSESVVHDSLMRRVAGHHGKGRVICTQFASNLHRLAGVKAAADAAGRKVCFVGMSLNTYLEAAHRVGKAPFDPKDLIDPKQLADVDPNEVLVVTTGSQAEPRAQLSMAAREESQMLTVLPTDLLLYSAKVIPGNEKKVTRMLNSLAGLGATIVQGASERLHTSGHAYQEELAEVLQYVKPQHFLPVHGEYSFLCAHAELAKRKAGINNVSVIRNGQMLGVWERRNAATISTGSMAVVDEVALVNYYNDGSRGTGTAQEMALAERSQVALQGIVIASVDVVRSSGRALLEGGLRARVRLTARAMWLDGGKLIEILERACHSAVMRLPTTASLQAVEKAVEEAVKKQCKSFNHKSPEVIIFTQEADPRLAASMPEAVSWPPPGRQQQPESSSPSRGPPGRQQQRQPQAWQEHPPRTPTLVYDMNAPTASTSAPPPRRGPSPAPAAAAAAAPPRQEASEAAAAGGAAAVAGGDAAVAGGDAAAAGGDGAAAGGRKRVVKKIVKKVIKRRVVKKAGGGEEGGAQGPVADVLPEGVLEQRRARNPRDNVGEETDVDFG